MNLVAEFNRCFSDRMGFGHGHGLARYGQKTFSFDEAKHPRGQPENAGQFVEKGQGQGASAVSSPPTDLKAQILQKPLKGRSGEPQRYARDRMVRELYQLLNVERYAGLFHEEDHPRGQPENAGQFKEKKGVGSGEVPAAVGPKKPSKKPDEDQGALFRATDQASLFGKRPPRVGTLGEVPSTNSPTTPTPAKKPETGPLIPGPAILAAMKAHGLDKPHQPLPNQKAMVDVFDAAIKDSSGGLTDEESISLLAPAAIRREQEELRKQKDNAISDDRIKQIESHQPVWTKIKGVDVLKSKGSHLVAVPISGKKGSAAFDILDLEKNEVLTQLKKSEVNGWMAKRSMESEEKSVEQKVEQKALFSMFRSEFARAMAQRYAYVWNEKDHPRDAKGLWIEKGSGAGAGAAGQSSQAPTPPTGQSFTVDGQRLQISDAFRRWVKPSKQPTNDPSTRSDSEEQRLLEGATPLILDPGQAAFQPKPDAPPREPPKNSAGRPEGHAVARVADLQVDPDRFQYKLNTNESGVTSQFEDIQFNPDLAGQIHVWRDPENGQTYVINGHHRYDLAKRSGFAGDLSVYYLDAADAKEARSKGALINIAGGNGTAVDAAKFMRDTGATPEMMQQEGVSLKGAVARDASILSKLSDRIFQKVTMGTYRVGRALAIAQHLPNQEDQERLDNWISNYEDSKNRDLPDSTIDEMAREAGMAGRTKETTKGLFGEEEIDRGLFVERAEIKSHLRRDITGRLNKFRAVATERAASTLQGANQINAERNRQEADRLANFLDDFDREMSYKGPVSDRVNQAAKELADDPRRRKQILEQLATELPRLLGTVPAVPGGETTGDDPRGGSAGGGGSAESAPGHQPPPVPGQRGFFSRARASQSGSRPVVAGGDGASLVGALNREFYRRGFCAPVERYATEFELKHPRDDTGRFIKVAEEVRPPSADPNDPHFNRRAKQARERTREASSELINLTTPHQAAMAKVFAAHPEMKQAFDAAVQSAEKRHTEASSRWNEYKSIIATRKPENPKVAQRAARKAAREQKRADRLARKIEAAEQLRDALRSFDSKQLDNVLRMSLETVRRLTRIGTPEAHAALIAKRIFDKFKPDDQEQIESAITMYEHDVAGYLREDDGIESRPRSADSVETRKDST